MAVRFSGARPMVANRFRICRRLNPASIRIRASSVSTYAQLPAEPLPKIVKRTGMADIKEKATTQQYFCHQVFKGLEVLPGFVASSSGEGAGASTWRTSRKPASRSQADISLKLNVSP